MPTLNNYEIIKVYGTPYRIDSLTRTLLDDRVTIEASPLNSWESTLYDAMKASVDFFAKLANIGTSTPRITKIIFSGPVTIVFWRDGSKTMVRRSDDDKYDREAAVTYAIAKRMFGNNTRIHKEIDKFAKSNAQRIAILKYIVSKSGYDVEKLLKTGKISYKPGDATQTTITYR